MTLLRVLSVASEVYPLIKTGGLADVTGALPAALATEGIEVATLLPGYPAVLHGLRAPEPVLNLPDFFGGPGRVLADRDGGGAVFLSIDAPHLYARDGNPYAGPDGKEWPDNAQRFAALAFAAAEIGRGALPGFVPDVVHAHDWQAGLAPAYLHYREGGRPGTVMTVHNLAFQGQVPRTLLAELRLPSRAYAFDGVEYYGTIGMLKAGLQLADRITTVSPSYAAEIMAEGSGMGLDGLLRARADVFAGILNGLDTTVWNPAADPSIASTYDARRLARRKPNKAALQRRMGLAEDDGALLFGVVSRLSWQKGLDLLLETLPLILSSGAQLALVGSGDPALELAYRAAAAAHPGRVGCVIGYDEALAHLVQAGADAILVPSRFEPCGLTQLSALRYGAVPVVARVGGLADTVIDMSPMAEAAEAGTGIQFAPVTADMFAVALRRTLDLWRRPDVWRAMQRRGMATDVSWQAPARRYAELYRAVARPRAA